MSVGVYEDVGGVTVLGGLVQVVHDWLVLGFDEVQEAVIASSGEWGFLVLVVPEGLPDGDHGADGGSCGSGSFFCAVFIDFCCEAKVRWGSQ